MSALHSPWKVHRARRGASRGQVGSVDLVAVFLTFVRNEGVFYLGEDLAPSWPQLFPSKSWRSLRMACTELPEC